MSPLDDINAEFGETLKPTKAGLFLNETSDEIHKQKTISIKNDATLINIEEHKSDVTTDKRRRESIENNKDLYTPPENFADTVASQDFNNLTNKAA